MLKSAYRMLVTKTWSGIRLANRIWSWITLWRESVAYGENLIVNGCLRIENYGAFEIGNNVRINSEFRAVPISHSTFTSFYVSVGAKIEIGNGVGISNSVLYSKHKIKICDNAFIGGGCLIYDTDFHSLDVDDRILHENEKNICSASVIINEGAFIGANSIVLKGVVIGKNSIVGAGSIVSKSIPDDEVWAGNPAQKIRSL